MFRLRQYMNRLRDGGINPTASAAVVRETAATALVDGDNGLGHLAMRRAGELAMQKAAQAGIGWVGVRNNNHAGPVALYVRPQTERGMIGLAAAVGSANHVPPFGGSDLLLGTNPIAIAAPAGRHEPFVLDMATIIEDCEPTTLVGVDPSARFLATARPDRRCAGAVRAGRRSGLAARRRCFRRRGFRPGAQFRRRSRRHAGRDAARAAAGRHGRAVRLGLPRRDAADGYFWGAAVALDPATRELAEDLRFPICRPGGLATLLRDAGLEAVVTAPLAIPTVFRDFEDYWTPFLGGQGRRRAIV